VVDTGGFEPVVKEGITFQMAKQTRQAIAESDAVIFVVDGRNGVAPQDMQIADLLRKTGRPVTIAVNKLEGLTGEGRTAEFYELGLGDPHAISSAHGDGVSSLMDLVLDALPHVEEEEEDAATIAERGLRVAIVGRPNAGKSTLINTLVGEERVIAFDMPGTTRDAISIPFERAGRKYQLIDTAGLRRRGKVFEAVEKFSVIKTLQAIESCHVAILMLDARQDVSDQDAHIAGFVMESGRALVVAVNKWDGLDVVARDEVKRVMARKLQFLHWAKFHFISALKGTGVDALMRSVDDAYTAATLKLSTPKITRVLREAVEHQQPPRHGIFRPKLRYAHQGGQNPPIIVVHGNALEHVSDVYKRYLESRFRRVFKLEGTPLRIEWKTSTNPYKPEA
jgi:GTP-binding protein